MWIGNRREGERIRIRANGVEVWVTVLESKHRVRLGISSERAVEVTPEERIHAKNTKRAIDAQ